MAVFRRFYFITGSVNKGGLFDELGFVHSTQIRVTSS